MKLLVSIYKKNHAWNIIGRLVFGASVYFVWQERNNRLFKKGARSCEQLFQVVYNTVRLKLMSIRLSFFKDELKYWDLWKLKVMHKLE